MNSTPFTAHGDEALEARIVAWVLGEASAFEAAELERLCEERPELMVFKRRMLALHDLLAEAETPQAGESWKLPPGKRKSLEEIYCDEKPIRLEVLKEKRIRRSGRRAFLAIAACVLLTLVITQLLPWKQTSEAIIEVKPRVVGMSPLGGSMGETSDASRMTPQFFGTEFEKIKSRNSLEKVVENLDLASRWDMDKQQAVEKLKDSIKTENVRGTDLIKIQVRQSDKKDADEIAREVAYAYKDYRQQIEKQQAERALAELNKAVRDQEDKVEERRKVLATIVRNKGIIYKGDDSFQGNERALAMRDESRKEAIKRGLDAQDYADVKREFETDQQLLQTMKLKLMGETIAKKAESDSVVVHEVPGAVAKPARPATEALASNSRSQRLETTIPAELIEGTPSPINVPNLESPTDGPAGSATWAARDSGIIAEATPKPQVNPQAPARPAAPSSSMAKVIAGNRASGTAVPVPDLAVNTPSLDFGNQDDFGAGWGEGKDSEKLVGGMEIVGGAKLELQSGLRSGDGAVTRNPIDAILNQPGRPAEGEVAGEKKMEAAGEMPVLESLFADKENAHPLASGGIVTEEVRYKMDSQPEANQLGVDFWDTSSVAGSKATGTEYELHSGYKSEYLFRGRDLGGEADRDSRLPDITTRSELSADEAVPAEEMNFDGFINYGSPIAGKEKESLPDLTELMEEIAASEDPYSTFSLNISDASFQIAQAALAKGEQPDPAGIKVEQFYNAVDYGDPAPSAGEPVAVSIEQAAHPVIPGRNLVRVALKTAAAGRSATQPLRLTLLVDQSGSMTRADRRAAMDKALAGLAELLTENDRVTVIGFSRTPRLLADGITGDKAGKLADLVNQTASEGGTNLEEAIKLGEQLAGRQKLAGAQNRIVLFTDGAANLGDADPQHLAAKVEQLRQQGVAFDIAGIAADGLNDELLGELARKGNGRYYVVGKGAEEDFAKQLAGAFRPAAENVKVQVRFNPERVTRYKLIGFEKDRLKTEDFRNDAVDAAELAAEEAGVAIYQIEPNPNGRGEIGEVSVRFRDTASGEMVERGWTIPHDAATPAIDRATPSMQLAVLSMLAAEKLKGGPLGEAIDFKQLTEAQANVKRFFGSNARVAEMLRMVDALK